VQVYITELFRCRVELSFGMAFSIAQLASILLRRSYSNDNAISKARICEDTKKDDDRYGGLRA